MGFQIQMPYDALAEYQVATKKDMSEVLNRAQRNIGLRAAEFTPKKDPETIEAELRKDQIGLKFITKRLVGLKGGAYKATKKGRKFVGGTFITTAKGRKRKVGRVTRKQIALRTRQFIARRKKRTGFLRAGWVAALIRAGFKTGKGGVILSGSKSTLGSGRKATAKSLRSFLSNAVYARLNGKSKGRISAVMRRALEEATNFVANDMQTHARNLMTGTAKKYSGQRKAYGKSQSATIASQIDALLRRG